MGTKKALTILAISLGLALTACGSATNPSSQSVSTKESDSSTHVHTFSDAWSADDEFHWHAATCEHTQEVKDKSAHTFGAWVIDKEATEESEGARHKICGICKRRIDETIPKVDHVHNWESPTYSWSLNYVSCTAKRTCSINRYHVEEETASSTYSVVTEPTVESVGIGRYTAQFTNPAFAKQQKDVTLPKINVPVTGISLDKGTLELSIGSYAILMATVSPYDATNRSVEWATSDDKITTVGPSGLVTGVGDGEAIITATTVDGGFTATCTVKVTHIAVDGVSLGTVSLTLQEGETGDAIYANVSPYTATNADVTWAIDDPGVATIETTLMGGCKVTGVKAGTTKVTATTVDGGFTTTCAVTVLEQKNFSYQVGDAAVEIYDYSSAFSSDIRAKVHVPVTNNGNVNIYVGTSSVDIEDEDGNLKQSVNYMSCHPNVIRPGETAYVYDDVSYTGDSRENLHGVPHITIKDASSADGIRYEAGDIAFVDDATYGFQASGTVTNHGEAASGLIVIAVLVFDDDGAYYTTLFTYVYDDLEPGASATFSASDTDMLYRRSTFTKNDIGSYRAYAYEQEFVI